MPRGPRFSRPPSPHKARLQQGVPAGQHTGVREAGRAAAALQARGWAGDGSGAHACMLKSGGVKPAGAAAPPRPGCIAP